MPDDDLSDNAVAGDLVANIAAVGDITDDDDPLDESLDDAEEDGTDFGDNDDDDDDDDDDDEDSESSIIDEDEDPDDIEADLDKILKDRIAAGDDESDEDEDEASVKAVVTGEIESVRARQVNEFPCPSCFLLVATDAVVDGECPHCGEYIGDSS